MSELGGFARLSLNEQAEIIQSVSTLVAERQTTFRRLELYALDSLFVELSFAKYLGTNSVEKIRYISNTASLQPYLREIKLPL